MPPLTPTFAELLVGETDGRARPLLVLALLLLGVVGMWLSTVRRRPGTAADAPGSAHTSTPTSASTSLPAASVDPTEHPGSPRRAPRAASLATALAASWSLVLIVLVLACAIFGDDGQIGFSGSATTVDGQPISSTVTADGLPARAYAVSVVLGVVLLAVVTVVASVRGRSWSAVVIAQLATGLALAVVLGTVAEPFLELAAMTSHSPDPPAWTALGAWLAVASLIVGVTACAVSAVAGWRGRVRS